MTENEKQSECKGLKSKNVESNKNDIEINRKLYESIFERRKKKLLEMRKT